jgi:7-cyano-7-deazaguanine synthase
LTVFPGKRAVALVSGGLDSVVSLAVALDEMQVRLVLFFDYRQRALARERDAAMAVANFYGLPFREVDIGWMGSLLPLGMRQPDAGSIVGPMPESALDTVDAVWIPNRNGVFLNAGAAFAEAYQCKYVIAGFNREEAEEFPDNRPEYVMKVNAGFEMSTRNGVEVVSFTQGLNKVETIRRGAELHAPLSVIWSCYQGQERMCGRCASCKKLRAALTATPEDERPLIEFEA